MTHRSVAIANAFLTLPHTREALTQMQLQKLVYVAHGWNWALNGQPLICEPVEAWRHGPVYRELYDHTKFFGKDPIPRLITPDDDDAAKFFLDETPREAEPYCAELNSRERAIIKHVWHRYGHLDGIQLSKLTHQRGTPWYETFTTKGRNARIGEDLIRTHYEQLANRARAGAATT